MQLDFSNPVSQTTGTIRDQGGKNVFHEEYLKGNQKRLKSYKTIRGTRLSWQWWVIPTVRVINFTDKPRVQYSLGGVHAMLLLNLIVSSDFIQVSFLYPLDIFCILSQHSPFLTLINFHPPPQVIPWTTLVRTCSWIRVGVPTITRMSIGSLPIFSLGMPALGVSWWRLGSVWSATSNYPCFTRMILIWHTVGFRHMGFGSGTPLHWWRNFQTREGIQKNY